MNSIIKKLLIPVFGLLTILFIISCDNKMVPPVPVEPVKTGTLKFHLHYYIGSSEMYNYNTLYTTDEGRRIIITRAKLYLSNIAAVRLDGSPVSIPDSVLLQTAENENYIVGKLPAGNYQSVRFKLGLDSLTNLKDSSAYSNGVLNKSEMWFGSSAQPLGYVFLNVQGKIDTTASGTATEDQMVPFSYKIGTNKRLKQVNPLNLNQTNPEYYPFTILPDQAQFVHFYVDLARLFNGIDLKNSANLQVNTKEENANEISEKIANNMPSMFYYE